MQIQATNVETSAGILLEQSVSLNAGQRLIAVSATEVDSAGNQSPAPILITLRYSTGVGIELRSGVAGFGSSLAWLGDIPIAQDVKLVVRFIHPPSGDLCHFAYATAEIGEQVHMSSPLNCMPTYQAGRAVGIFLDGAADATALAVQPPAGWAWRIYELFGYHDDSVNRTLNWSLQSGTAVQGFNHAGISCAASVLVHYTIDPNTNLYVAGHPAEFDGNVYPALIVSALTAGKHLFIRGHALQYGAGYWT